MSALPILDRKVQKAIVENEITLWNNTRYQLQLRFRVQKAIGGGPEQLKPLEDELVKCESALDELQKVLGELNGKA